MRTTFRMEDDYIAMVRGDTLSFNLELEDFTEDLTGAYFTIMESSLDLTPSVQKSLGNGIEKISTGLYGVRMEPDDTKDLEVGQYWYDLVIECNDDRLTVLRGVIELLQNFTEVS